MHHWKPYPSPSQPPTHLKPLRVHSWSPHAGPMPPGPAQVLGSGYWQPNGGWHPLVLKKGKKPPLSSCPPQKTIIWGVRGEQSTEVHTALHPTVLPQAAGVWTASSHRDSPDFTLWGGVPANWSTETGHAVPKGQEKIIPGQFMPKSAGGCLLPADCIDQMSVVYMWLR